MITTNQWSGKINTFWPGVKRLQWRHDLKGREFHNLGVTTKKALSCTPTNWIFIEIQSMASENDKGGKADDQSGRAKRQPFKQSGYNPFSFKGNNYHFEFYSQSEWNKLKVTCCQAWNKDLVEPLSEPALFPNTFSKSSPTYSALSGPIWMWLRLQS